VSSSVSADNFQPQAGPRLQERGPWPSQNGKTAFSPNKPLATIPPDRENVRRSHLPSPIDIESNTASPTTKRVLALLALAALINYIDRGNLSIAASLLKDELNLSPAQLGILLSSFFWTYSLFLPVSGWLADHFDAKWVMAIGFFIWSGATAVTGGLHAFSALLAARLMLGIGESAAYPCYARTLVRHVPEVGRGFANALIAAGVGCGPALGTFFGGTLMARYGWRPFFILLGLISMVWLIPWFTWIPRCGTAISRGEKRGPGFVELLKQRSMWGTCGGLFGANYVLYFEITWLPYYLVRERHLSMGTMAKIGGVGYLCYSFGAVVFGWISDRWIAAGGTPTLVRKTIAGVGAGSAGLLLLGCALAGPTTSVILLLLAFLAGGMCGSNIWAITQTIAGPQMTGRWTGWQNFLGNLAGIIAPAVTGFVVDYTGQFILAFVIMAVIALLAALSYFYVIGPVKEIAWEV
jgi:MFS transporter, ACS family, D-galactonate transporter